MQHILFVDDDPDYLSSCKRTLRDFRNEWSLHLADSVQKALLELKQTPMDLVVSDYLMPELSGLDLLEQIKKTDGLKQVPVIVVTGQSDHQIKLKALRMGAVDLLNKPCDKAELVARIKNVLALKNYQDRMMAQNLQLENEIADRNRYLSLSADINQVLVQETQLTRLLQECCQSIVDHMGVALARIWIIEDGKNRLKLVAGAGIYTHIDGEHQFIEIGKYKIGLIAKNKKPQLTNSVVGDPQFSNQEWAKKEKIVAFAGHPLIVKNRLIGVMGMFSKNELKDSSLIALSAVANGIALGIAQKRTDEKAHFYSFYDGLTHLPNRRFFNVFLGRIINHANRYLKRFALVLIDVDSFTRINETLGHASGDRCLKIISQRLLSALRNSDCLARISGEDPPIARMGGDEFAVLLQDTSDIHHISLVLRRLLEELSKSIELVERELIMSASIGIAVYPDDGNSITELLKNTQTALYHAKAKGKSSISFYSQSMNIKSLKMLDLEMDLRRAIDNKEFRLFYQPQVNAFNYSVTGAEALIRWQGADGKMITPNKFIPIAESTGLIVPMGEWAAKTACRQNVQWQKQGLKKIPLAVNVSGRQFGQENFSNKIIGIIEDSGLSPEYLKLEITETTLMIDPDMAIQSLKRLKEKGIKISLDDFGTGYSSMAYLQKLPIDQLKIDLSFVRNILSNPNDASMVKAIISMAHDLNLEVVAEGVEDVRQLEYLAALGCDTVQGFLFSRPVPETKFQKLLQTPFQLKGIGPAGRNKENLSAGPGPKQTETISVQWCSSFCVGEKTIDRQHRNWFKMLHQAQRRLLGDFKRAVGEISHDALAEMLDYTRYHFLYEEAYMKKINFPEIDSHKKSHDRFVQKLNQLNQDLNTGKIVLTREIIDIMESWFIEHILIEDQTLKQLVKPKT